MLHYYFHQYSLHVDMHQLDYKHLRLGDADKDVDVLEHAYSDYEDSDDDEMNRNEKQRDVAYIGVHNLSIVFFQFVKICLLFSYSHMHYCFILLLIRLVDYEAKES